MVSELNELKWLLIPLYPMIVVVMFGAWLVVRLRRAKTFRLHMTMLGIKLDLVLGEVTHCAECGIGTPHRRMCDTSTGEDKK